MLVQRGWWLAVPAACLLLARLAYRGTIASALTYGDGMRTAIDLHGFELLGRAPARATGVPPGGSP